jgi:uncharacterized membrane protein
MHVFSWIAIGLAIGIGALALWLHASAARAVGSRPGAPNGLPDESLETQLARLGALERRIFSKLLLRQRVARDTNAEFAESASVGDRAADRMATFGGSWVFLGIFGATLLVWIVWNVERPASFDPYPFILLNLVLSCLAAVQAPIILMSQNRMAARDRVEAHHDYEVNLKAEMEIVSLHEKLDAQREELWKQALAMLEQQRGAMERLERRLTVGDT